MLLLFWVSFSKYGTSCRLRLVSTTHKESVMISYLIAKIACFCSLKELLIMAVRHPFVLELNREHLTEPTIWIVGAVKVDGCLFVRHGE